MNSLSRSRPRARNAVDMTTKPWGKLTALRPGSKPYWWFRCPAGHEVLLNGHVVRAAVKRGAEPECRACVTGGGK